MSRLGTVSTGHQRGVGLLEVLLAVVLMSIGFLAAARMQVQGMQYSQNAYFLSQATLMARDMSDRMRSNRPGVLAGHYDGLTTGTQTTEPSCLSGTSACSPEDIAIADVHAWRQYLHGSAEEFVPLLPSGPDVSAQGLIERDDTTGVYTISLQWSESSQDGEQAQQIQVQFLP